VFSSTSSDVAGSTVDLNSASDIFLFDRASAGTTLVSHALGLPMVAGNGLSFDAAMSADGPFPPSG
jgi:hydrogenase maturation factor HypE